MQVPLQVTKNNPTSIFNAGSNPSNIINVGGATFFTATDSNNVTGLWRVNGTLPPVFVSNIRLGSQSGLNDLAPVVVNGSLFFANSDINNNIEIWKIDSGFGSTNNPTSPVRVSLPLFTISPRFSTLTNSNGNLYFIANENTSVSSLWGLDFNGNPLRMGSLPTNLQNPGNIINVNGTVFFTATNSLNTSPNSPNPATELFILGTGGKIISVRNTFSSMDNPINPVNFVTNNGKLYFVAADAGNRFGRELWTLDSRFTPVRVSDIAISNTLNPSGSSNPAELTAFGGTLYFTAEQQPGNRQLWRLDANGIPSLVKEVSTTNIGNYRNLTVANGNLYFSKDISNGSELWRLDGNGSAIRISSPLFTNISNLTNINGALYFSARDSRGSELWTLDSFGTPKLTSEINFGSGSSNPSNLTAVDNILYFSADDGKTGQELWQIDPRNGIPKQLGDINQKSRQVPANLVNVNDTLYYTFNDISGMQLWRLDKATGNQVKITSPIWSSISNVTTVNNNLYFTANDSSGQRLWKLESANADKLTSIDSLGGIGTTYEKFLNVNGNLFVVLVQPDRVKRLWRIDSNGISTSINFPGISANNNISNLINYNGLLHFTTTRSDGLNELVRINSTGVSEPISIPSTSAPLSAITKLTVVGNKLNFVTENSDGRRFLWSTDQNRMTSQIFLPFSTGGSLNLSQIIGVGNSLHFVAQNGIFPAELWRLDDFGKPVRIMTAPNSSQPAFENLTNINGTLYFTNNFGKEIWKSDQQSPPTRLLSPNSSDPNFRISNLTNINGNLYVNIADSIAGQELWKIETNNSFTQMSDINPGVKSSNPANLTYANGKLYFVADNGIDSDEIWSLDVGFPNVAPTLADTNISFTINEDAASPFGAVGFLVSSIARLGVGGNITDANGPNTGIAIVGGDTRGTLFYSTDNGLRWNFVDIPSLSNSKALLLSADANNRLYFRPATNFSGTLGSAITFRAWDGSSGQNGAFANAGSNGGFTAFSTTTDVVSMTVNSINDVPVLSKGYSFSIPNVYENGTVLGKIAVFDPDSDTLNWSITSGNKDTNGDGTFAFSINANTGEIQISDRTDLDPQTTPSFQLQLSVNDGTVTVKETVDIKLVRSAGDLDPNFGNGGKVIRSGLGRAWDVEQLADGKILTLGYGIDTTTGLSKFAFTRHNANGSLDNSFGNGGNVVTAISPMSSSQATKMQVQSDGKIIIAGSRSGTSGSDFVVAKFNSDGTGDTSFGVNGITSTDMGTTYDYSRAIAIQADGKVLITGIVWNSTSSYDFGVARYNNDGSLDTSFGNGGKVITQVGTSTDYAEAIAIQTDGRIIVSGTASDSQGTNFASVRYNSDGSLDTTFGNQGKVRTLLNSSSYGYATAIQDDGKILVAGNSNSQFAVARYNSDGSLDTAFGNQGKVSTLIADYSATARKIEIQTDGKIVVVGDAYNSSSSSYEFAIARYNVDGSLDSSFGNGGRIFTPIGERTQDYGYSATIQTDGKIVVAGDSGGNLALVRYEGELQTPLQSQTMSNLPASASPSPQETIPNTGGWKLDSLLLGTQMLSPIYNSGNSDKTYRTPISSNEPSIR